MDALVALDLRLPSNVVALESTRQPTGYSNDISAGPCRITYHLVHYLPATVVSIFHSYFNGRNVVDNLNLLWPRDSL